MDQYTLDNALNADKFLDLFADLMHGKNLLVHKQTMQTALEAYQYVIDVLLEDGEEVTENLEFQDTLKLIALQIDTAIIDDNYRPDYLSHMEL